MKTLATFKTLAVGISICGPFTLCAQNAPVITVQPTSKAVGRGATISFSVAASSADPVSYQWRVNQIDIPLATNNNLIITNAQFAQAGDYQAVVANAAGSVTSLVARLVVGPEFVKITTGG